MLGAHTPQGAPPDKENSLSWEQRSQVSPLYQAVKVRIFAASKEEIRAAKISTLTSPGACETSERRSSGVVEPLQLTKSCGEQGFSS